MTGDELRTWRERQRWTQEAAGIWYGLPPRNAARTWRRWELGERSVPRPLVKRIREHAARAARPG